MKLLICKSCGSTTRLYPGRSITHDFLCWSPVLDEYVHPSCLDWELNQFEQAYGITMEPLRRLLGFENVVREWNEYRDKKHIDHRK